jgi:hypothetical protein
VHACGVPNLRPWRTACATTNEIGLDCDRVRQAAGVPYETVAGEVPGEVPAATHGSGALSGNITESLALRSETF